MKIFETVLVLGTTVFANGSYTDSEISLQGPDKEHQLALFFLAMNPAAARRGGRLGTMPRAQLPQMKVDMQLVKKLRDESGVGLMGCKTALEEAGGDMDAAMKELRKKGLAKAEKRSGRATGQGTIVPYIHFGGNLGVMVELACETDFVAKNADFIQFGKNIAMQIAASPDVEFVDEESIDPAFIEKEREIAMASEDLKGKPEEIKAKMVEGRIGKILKDKVLLTTEYFKEDGMTVGDLIKNQAVKVGENIKVVRFTRYQVGETQK